MRGMTWLWMAVQIAGCVDGSKGTGEEDTDETDETDETAPPDPIGDDPGVPPERLVTLEEHILNVEAATFDEVRGRSDAEVADVEAFEGLRRHIQTMYDGVEVVHTFWYGGAFADCVTIESQPSVRQLGVEPNFDSPDGSTPGGSEGEEPGLAELVESPLRLGLVDHLGQDVACPDGSIPMRRLDLRVMARFRDLDAFLAKHEDGSVGEPEEEQLPEESAHLYATGRQVVENFGGNSWLNLWNPNVPSGSAFSLSQQWYTGGIDEGEVRQTVEGGWQRYPKKYDSDEAVLFIFWTADNYGTKKCYNLDCAAFVQINSGWYLAGPWDHYSAAGGTQWGFEMQWKLYRGNWWLFLRGRGGYEAVGYYPTSLFGTGQLARSAERFTFGGEIAGVSPYPEMGSGDWSTAGWQRAAFQNTIFYITRDENNGTGTWASLYEMEYSPDCFTVDVVPAASGGSWGTYLWYGGPGGACTP